MVAPRINAQYYSTREVKETPTIKQQPASATVSPGKTITLKVVIDCDEDLYGYYGRPENNERYWQDIVRYQWKKDGITISGATTSTLVMENAREAHAGTYVVVVWWKDSNKSVTSTPAVVAVSTGLLPTVIRDPLSQTLSEGQTATFLISVLGTPAPKFQWRRNGALIPGATAMSLSIPNISMADAGLYDALVSNLNGTVLSRAATLHVLVPYQPTPTATSAATPAPTQITAQPTDLNLAPGQAATLAIAAAGENLSFQWKKNGTPLPGATHASYTIPQTAAADTGMYSVTVSGPGGSAESRAAILNVATGGSSRLVNLSTRGFVPAGGALTPGFSWRGAGTKNLLVRAVGPALARFGVDGVLADPRLDIIPAGTSAATVSNDNWSLATQLPNFTVATAACGAFALDAGSSDAAVLTSLAANAPRNYSVRITSANAAADGIVLAEVYDTDTSTSSGRLTSVSTLGYAGSGDRSLVPGFTIVGSAPKRLLLRAVGPGLASFGVMETLSDPRLSLRAVGTETALASNDNWGGDDTVARAVTAAGAFALAPASNDAALVVMLPPGGYTVTVSGAAGTYGNVLVEIYDLDP